MVAFVETGDIPDKAFEIFRKKIGSSEDPNGILFSSRLQSWLADKEKELGISIVATFGINEPSYLRLLEPYLNRLERLKNPRFLLAGSQSRHSAEEFFEFIKKINNTAYGIVMDIQRYGLEKSSVKGLIQGDVLKMPFTVESLDGVMTNYLLENLVPATLDNYHYQIFLSEVLRVLKPGGVLVMAERLPWKSLPKDYYYHLLEEDFPMDNGFKKEVEDLGFRNYQSCKAISYKSRASIGKLSISRDPDPVLEEIEVNDIYYSYAIIVQK